MGEQKYCKYCGTANPASTSFCKKCGKAFAGASASSLPPPSTTKEKKSSTWLRILEIGAGLTILILGVAAFYPGVDWGWTTFIAYLAVALSSNRHFVADNFHVFILFKYLKKSNQIVELGR